MLRLAALSFGLICILARVGILMESAWALPLEKSLVTNTVPSSLPLLDNPLYSIVSARIIQIPDGTFSNASPPTGKLIVERVIRGRGIPLEPMTFSIVPPVRPMDLAPHSNSPSQSWLEQEVSPPEQGQSYVIFVFYGGEVEARTAALAVHPPLVVATPQNIEIMTARMTPMERAGHLQLALAAGILVLAICSVLFVFPSVRILLPHRVRALLAWGCPLAGIILYWIYESGISIYSNIRIDVLVLWPAVACCFVSLGVKLWRRRSQ